MRFVFVYVFFFFFFGSACDYWTLSPKKVKGNIIFCRGFSYQDYNVKYSGDGAGAIMTAEYIKLDIARPLLLPATVVSIEDGDQIDRYINSTK